MPAIVENMFYHGQRPWHGLGEELENPPTISEALDKAGLNWSVKLEQLWTLQGISTDHNAVLRSTDDAILGVVGPRYVPLQNAEAFDFFKPFVDSGEVELNTAGSLCGGSKVWILAKICRDNMEIVKGDEIVKYLLLSNSHDGSLAVRVGYTPIRVVCWNTMQMAHSTEQSKLIRIRHSKSVKENLDNIRDTINLINEEFEATAEQYRLLARHSINQKDVEKYVKKLLKADAEEEESKISVRRKNQINKILELVESGKGSDLARGTAWQMYNGFNEWLNWQRGNKTDTRLNSLWFGESSRLNKRAFDLALTIAG